LTLLGNENIHDSGVSFQVKLLITRRLPS
jgi:hypothetical protein